MLYVTTRSNIDTYTSHRAVSTNIAPDGGHFVPFKLKCYTKSEIADLKDKSFNQIIADILNIFFTAGLNAWDLDFAIGKNSSNIHAMNHRMLVCELWHNPGAALNYCIQQIYAKLCEGKHADEVPGDWAKTSIRIAFLFAVYGQLLQQEHLNAGDELDLVVSAEDFLMPMSAWYARSMGLPINTVICACDDRSNVWELIHKGSYATAGVDKQLLLGIEKLICVSISNEEALRFAAACEKKEIYNLDPEKAPAISRGFYCTVAGHGRADATVNSVYRSNHYIMDPMAALCFSALQDYRAGTGIGRVSMLLSESSPLNHIRQIINATGLTEADLRNIIHR